MKTIAILYGGKSGEHEVSLRSGGSVYTNMDKSLFNPLLIGVNHDGVWFLQSDPGFQKDGKSLQLETDENQIVSAVPGRGLFNKGKKLNIDLVFPVLHGTFGEDGTIQGLLETAGIPYAGSGVLGSALGMDKAAAKQIWLQSGLPVVPFLIVQEDTELPLNRAANDFGFPLFVKPANAGSSLGVLKVESMVELKEAVSEGFRYDTKLLIEPAIDGQEVECSVTGNFQTTSYLPGEIISENYYDYDSKYIHPESVKLLIPADLSDKKRKEVRELAEAAFKVAGCEGFARVDFFIESITGRVLINEINTIPGFTDISMFSKMCSASGLPYSDMLSKVIRLAEERYIRRNKLIYRKE